MAFDPMPAGGSGPHGPWCVRCNRPITAEQPSVQISFEHDADGHRGLTGLYHEHCSQPFQSLARAMKALSFRPF